MDYKQLAERLFPDVTTTVDDLEARYPILRKERG